MIALEGSDLFCTFNFYILSIVYKVRHPLEAPEVSRWKNKMSREERRAATTTTRRGGGR